MIPKIVRVADAAEIMGLASGTVRNLISMGKMPRPAPIYPGSRSVGWSEEDFQGWLESHKKTHINQLADEKTAKL